MAITSRLLGSGISPQAATNIVGDTASGLTATGTTQADALQLSAINNEFTTVASGAGAKLPAVNAADMVMVYNGGANALLVYGQTGEAINNGAANASFSLAANKSALFYKRSATNWAANLSA